MTRRSPASAESDPETSSERDAPRPGRPRSERARAAILRAARELLDSESYASVNMQSIADRAGVGKQTIYRWWPSKAAVILESLAESAASQVEIPDTGSLESDLVAFLTRTFRAVGRASRILSVLMAEAQLDPEFAEEFHTRFIARRRNVVAQILARAADRGEVAQSADRELLIDLIYGPMWYRLLNRHGPLGTSLAMQLARVVVDAARQRAP